MGGLMRRKRQGRRWKGTLITLILCGQLYYFSLLYCNPHCYLVILFLLPNPPSTSHRTPSLSILFTTSHQHHITMICSTLPSPLSLSSQFPPSPPLHHCHTITITTIITESLLPTIQKTYPPNHCGKSSDENELNTRCISIPPTIIFVKLWSCWLKVCCFKR